MVDAPEWAWVRDHVIDVDHPFRPPRAGVDAAVVDAARRPPPRGLGRGDLRGGVGPTGKLARRAGAPGARPRALGGVPILVRRDRRPHRRGRRRRRPPPATVLLLGGDVHCNYTAAAAADGRRASRHHHPPAHDVAVPQRHPAGRQARQPVLNRKTFSPLVHRLARWAGVADVGMDLARRARPVVRQRRDDRRVRRPLRPSPWSTPSTVGDHQALERSATVDLTPS